MRKKLNKIKIMVNNKILTVRYTKNIKRIGRYMYYKSGISIDTCMYTLIAYTKLVGILRLIILIKV